MKKLELAEYNNSIFEIFKRFMKKIFYKKEEVKVTEEIKIEKTLF